MDHIGNDDTRIMVRMAVIVGGVAISSDMFPRGVFCGGRSSRSGGRGGAQTR